MAKRVFLVFVLLLTTFLFGASEFDKDIVVKNQTRNDKVKTVFKDMMNKYEEEDLAGFFSYVSEDRFHQDYMTFYDAIDNDIRVYDILSIETWVDKITEDGVKRFLYVRWEKRYESSSSDTEINQLGYSRFLFDEINGKYKLIELAGNNFWGGSLPEWTEEVPDIAGQEEYATNSGTSSGGGSSPSGPPSDLTIHYAWCVYISSSNGMVVEIENISAVDAVGPFYIINTYTGASYTYNGTLSAGQTDNITITSDTSCNGQGGETVEINPTPHQILESDYNNNTASSTGGP